MTKVVVLSSQDYHDNKLFKNFCFVTTFSKSKTVSIIFLEKNAEMLFEAVKSFMFLEEGGEVSSQVV